jgi:hypothetical protein
MQQLYKVLLFFTNGKFDRTSRRGVRNPMSEKHLYVREFHRIFFLRLPAIKKTINIKIQI